MGRGPYWDESWNPVSGCTPVSEGCRNCWARSMLRRFGSKGGEQRGAVVLHHDRLDRPLRWKRPRTIAVNFLGDLFHEDVPLAFVGRVLATARALTGHRFLFLTKRPERMRRALLAFDCMGDANCLPCEHLWFGVSVEDQKTADERIPLLLDTPAAHRWVSIEPQIGFVWLERYMNAREDSPRCVPRIDWVVQGCESGPRRRPFSLDWARSMHDQCADAGVPYFLKQAPYGLMVAHAPLLDGVRHKALPWEEVNR